MEQATREDDPFVTSVGMRGKRGWVHVHVHRSGLLRVYKESGELIGEYENAAMAWDFARQQSGFGG